MLGYCHEISLGSKDKEPVNGEKMLGLAGLPQRRG